MPSKRLNSLKAGTKHTLRRVTPTNIIDRNLQRKTIMNFVERHGLVYFGYVNHLADEHRIIRGLTVSPHQRDNHYAIGTFDGYDVAFVQRTVQDGLSKKSKNLKWLVFEIDLQSQIDLPHIFIGSNAHSGDFYKKLFSTFVYFRQNKLSIFDQKSSSINNKYSLYTAPAYLVSARNLINEALAEQIAINFFPLAIEISSGSIYIYADNQRATPNLLTKMLKNSVWLARQLDQQIQSTRYI
ncbi:MAG: hypothetical protein L0H36_01700 [bacterium]|nr:hypothetical protein [bacterium]